MASDPNHIGTPKAWAATISNSTTAVDLVAPSGTQARLENLVIFNHDSGAADVQIIYYDGATAHPFLEEEVAAGGSWKPIEAIAADAALRFFLVADGEKLQIKTPTAVTGDVVAYGNGGEY